MFKLRQRKMGETKPVPRGSPWGMPEGEHQQTKAHCCNDQAENVIQVSEFHSSFYFFFFRLALAIFLKYLLSKIC